MRLATWAARPLSARAFVASVVAALAALMLSFEASVRPVQSVAGSDVTLYEGYGSRMLDGAMPYSDFAMEYPPGATAMFVLPATRLVEGDSAKPASWVPPNTRARRYYRGFTLLVLLLVATSLLLTASTLRSLQRPAYAAMLALAVVATSPLMIGQVVPERFDVLPAALTAAALALSVRGRYRSGAALLGLGAATKVYPALLVPVLVLVVLRQRRPREAVEVAVIAVAVALVVFVPFAVASFGGTWDALRNQFRGGLHIESFGGSILVLAFHGAEQIGIRPASPLTTQGAGGGLIRIVLAGPGVGAAEVVMKVLLLLALCLLFLRLYGSNKDHREDLLRYAAATVAVLLVLGTVLSPQYVFWLIPLVPLVGGRSGILATLFLVAAAALTNVWIPDHYFDYQDGLDAGPAALLFARNLALLATAVALVSPSQLRFRGRVVPLAQRDGATRFRATSPHSQGRPPRK